MMQGDCAQLSVAIRIKVRSGSNQTQLSVLEVWFRKPIYADQRGKRNLIYIVSLSWIKNTFVLGNLLDKGFLLQREIIDCDQNTI